MLYRLIIRRKKRRELDVPEDAVLLLSVGELNVNKNHRVIIKALAKVNDSKIHYAIAGSGSLMNELEELARENSVQSQVHLLGYRRDVPELYSAADICVFPSIREGLGLAAVEGMATGLPLIVSDNRGTRGFLKEENAITCRYDDVQAFAAAIMRLRDDQELREQMGKANLELSKDFDVQKICERMRQIYLEYSE